MGVDVAHDLEELLAWVSVAYTAWSRRLQIVLGMDARRRAEGQTRAAVAVPVPAWLGLGGGLATA